MQFQRYPMIMTHPNARQGKAVPINKDAAGQPSRVVDYQGVPAFMPPVTVNNEDQEERHKAMGYLAPNGDAAAFNQVALNPDIGIHEFHEYPKQIGDVVVNSREEEDALTEKLLVPLYPDKQARIDSAMTFTGPDGDAYKLVDGQMVRVSDGVVWAGPVMVAKIPDDAAMTNVTQTHPKAADYRERAKKAAATKAAKKAKAEGAAA